MSTQRKRSGAEFQARGAVEARKGANTLNAVASTEGVHPRQRTPWKQPLEQEGPPRLSAGRDKRAHDHAALQAPVSQPMGPLNVALAWLKKPVGVPR